MKESEEEEIPGQLRTEGRTQKTMRESTSIRKEKSYQDIDANMDNDETW